jgi:hypothetical protein
MWDPELKAYFKCPIGNSPENMPINTSLNQDVHAAFYENILLSGDLDNDDPKTGEHVSECGHKLQAPSELSIMTLSRFWSLLKLWRRRSVFQSQVLATGLAGDKTMSSARNKAVDITPGNRHMTAMMIILTCM